MQLILLNKCNVVFIKNDKKHLLASGISLSSRDAISDDEKNEQRDKLAGEIFTEGTSNVSIELRKHQIGSNKFTLFLKCTTESNDVLKHLRERFQDKIKISVTMESTTNKDYCVSTGNMTINSEVNMCKSKVLHLAPELFDQLSNFMTFWYSVNMTITAHIHRRDVSVNNEGDLPRKIFENGLFADLTITCQNGAEIRAHKCFLSAFSNVLQKNFESGMIESQTATLDMTDMSESGVKAFLRYIYLKELEEHREDMEIAYELLYAAHKYDAPKLEASMIAYMLESKDEDFLLPLAFTIYTFVRNIESATELKSKTVRILFTNIEELEDLLEYKELFRKTPHAAMELCKEFALHARSK